MQQERHLILSHCNIVGTPLENLACFACKYLLRELEASPYHLHRGGLTISHRRIEIAAAGLMATLSRMAELQRAAQVEFALVEEGGHYFLIRGFPEDVYYSGNKAAHRDRALGMLEAGSLEEWTLHQAIRLSHYALAREPEKPAFAGWTSSICPIRHGSSTRLVSAACPKPFVD